MTNGLKRDDSSGLQMSPFLSGGHLQRRLWGGIDFRCNIAENTLIQSRQLLKLATFDYIRTAKALAQRFELGEQEASQHLFVAAS